MSDPQCLCDAYPVPHEPGLAEAGRYCERLYTKPTISPHLFRVDPDGNLTPASPIWPGPPRTLA